jgi:hypothetical protein
VVGNVGELTETEREGSNPPLIPSHPQGGAAQAAQEAPTPQPQVDSGERAPYVKAR